MSNTAHLESVEQGTATAAEARQAIAAILRDATKAGVATVYTALRAWVWKALDSRRRDDAELREWYSLLEGVEGRLSGEFGEHANRIQVLYELISESIAVAETVSTEQVLKREHVCAVLALLLSSPAGKLDRTDIGGRLALKQANLTRVLNLMCLAGLIERQPKGREAVFQLTHLGQAEAAKLSAETQPTQREELRNVENDTNQPIHLKEFIKFINLVDVFTIKSPASDVLEYRNKVSQNAEVSNKLQYSPVTSYTELNSKFGQDSRVGKSFLPLSNRVDCRPTAKQYPPSPDRPGNPTMVLAGMPHIDRWRP